MGRKLRSDGFRLYYTLLEPIYPLELMKTPSNSSSDFLYLTSILQLSKTYTHTHTHTVQPTCTVLFFSSISSCL